MYQALSSKALDTRLSGSLTNIINFYLVGNEGMSAGKMCCSGTNYDVMTMI